jgi:hypothetical protein
MGTGSAGPRAPGETEDEPREAGQRRDRVVPPYVDDLARRGRQQREPEREPADADEPGGDAARAGATALPAASSAWSAWSGARTGDQDTADAGAAASTGPDAAGDTGDHGTGAGAQGDDAAGAVRAGAAGDTGGPPGAAQPTEASGGGEHRDAGADEPGETAGGDAGGPAALDDEVTVVPGIPRYHRRGCILIRFLSDDDLETTTRREAEAAGSVPCKACQPDKPPPAGQG